VQYTNDVWDQTEQEDHTQSGSMTVSIGSELVYKTCATVPHTERNKTRIELMQRIVSARNYSPTPVSSTNPLLS